MTAKSAAYDRASRPLVGPRLAVRLRRLALRVGAVMLTLPPLKFVQSRNGAKVRKHLTQERLRELLHYDPETGVFTWLRNAPPRGRAGREAGILVEKRPGCFYRKIGIGGRSYYGHHLAWLYVHGEIPAEIDHADGDGANNRIANLRPCTRTQNNGNRRIDRRNTSGFKGVFWFAQTQRWHAKITFNGKQIHLGYFDDPVMAKAAHDAKAVELFGEFARSA